ncbi:MAG: hypothetical protein Q4Q06_07010, partial [Bacteroidota bacterium]|nr:hypothetical protein [Bacteroidota bacterium]
MKKIYILLLTFICAVVVDLHAQNSEQEVCYPYIFTKEYAVVGISAKTTDKELLEIRKNILKYTSIRFTNFDVI